MRTFLYTLASVLLVLQIFLWFTPEIEIEGNAKLIGTHLFPTLVILNADGIYHFHDDLFNEFRHYNNKTIKIKSKVKKTELADGSKIFITPTIYKASVIDN